MLSSTHKHSLRTTWSKLTLGAVVAGVLWGGVAQAQMVPAPPPLKSAEGRKEATPKSLEGVGIDEKLRAQVPLNLTFVDEAGQTVTLADYFDSDKPVLLNLGYYECPMLCGLVWNGMAKSLRDLSWTPGKEFTVVTVSFNPEEGPVLAKAKKQTMVDALERPEAASGWHFLTGDEANVRALADAVGFQYRWVESQKQFAHAAAIILLTPEGKVARYLYGIEFPSSKLRLSLVEASEGKAGSTTDQLILYCFHYDPGEGRYTLAAMNLMRAGGVVTLVVLFAAVGTMLFRDNRRRRAMAERAQNNDNESVS